MKMSERTKKLKKKKNIFNIISKSIWACLAIFCVVLAFIKVNDHNFIASESFKKVIVGLGMMTSMAVIVGIFISNKLRTTVYMLCVVFLTLIYGKVAMVISFVIWGIDEYIFHALYLRYREAYRTNKEIDLRME